MAAAALMQDNVWLQRNRFEEAEAYYYAVQAGTATAGQNAAQGGGGSLRNEISQARQQIQNALNQPGQGGSGGAVQTRLDDLEKENKDLRKTTNDLRDLIKKLENRVTALEKGDKGGAAAPAASKPAPAPAEDDDDFDLFGSEDEEEVEAREQAKKEAVEKYKAKKSAKPALIAKSSVILDCKPWDDETDMKEMERLVRSIEKDGLNWGAAKLVDLAYGIKKLTIICVVEDEKISVEDLKEEIEEFEDYVQSVDIAAFNKI